MRVPSFLRLVWAALRAASNDNVPRLGASLAYYTLFAIAPVLLVAIAIAGLVFGPAAVRGQIGGQIQDLLGPEAGRAVQNLLAAAGRHSGGVLATVIGGVTFLLAAIGAFLELQNALNTIWCVKPRPGVNLRAYILNRLRALGLMIAMGFLLMVSLAVSAGLAALGNWFTGGVTGLVAFWQIANLVLSIAVLSTLFALVYRVLPDVRLAWRDVWLGGVITAVLFTVGKELIGLYLGRSTTASAYGAAGSLVVLLLWVYYSSQIVLLGAEFTRVVARQRHSRPPPEPYAVPTSSEQAAH